MGYFGTGLSTNDQYLDIDAAFFSLYNKGYEVEEISAHLIEANQEYINEHHVSSPDTYIFWYALANAQWECKKLQPYIYQKVKHFIESGIELEFWNGPDQVKRKKVLDKFLEKISVERPTAKPRKIIKPPLFKKGDCIAVKLSNGNYGGIVILEAIFDREKERTVNLAAATRINMPTKPLLEDFINAEILITNFEFDNDRQASQQINWVYENQQNKVKGMIEVTGSIGVTYHFTPEKCYGSICSSGAWFASIAEYVLKQYKSEETKQVYEHTKTIKELTQSKTWRYW